MRSAIPKEACCAIALGSNLGDSKTTLTMALKQLDQAPHVRLEARSSFYQTKALTLPGSPPQPDYLNGCVTIETRLKPHELLTVLQRIETQFGRVRREQWGARTLDLDLLLYGDLICKSDDLEIPHPRMLDRAFVLVPLAEIAPDWIHPIVGMSIAELASKINQSDIQKLNISDDEFIV